jgi:hypothetical protein
MYLPSRAVVSEWQRAGVFGDTVYANYGAISAAANADIVLNPLPTTQPRPTQLPQQRQSRQLTMDELLELEDRAQRIELFDPTTLENITFTELVSAIVPSQMLGRAFFGNNALDDDEGGEEEIEFELPADLVLAWNVAVMFLMGMAAVTLFITIMLFIKIESGQ